MELSHEECSDKWRKLQNLSRSSCDQINLDTYIITTQQALGCMFVQKMFYHSRDLLSVSGGDAPLYSPNICHSVSSYCSYYMVSVQKQITIVKLDSKTLYSMTFLRTIKFSKQIVIYSTNNMNLTCASVALMPRHLFCPVHLSPAFLRSHFPSHHNFPPRCLFLASLSWT